MPAADSHGRIHNLIKQWKSPIVEGRDVWPQANHAYWARDPAIRRRSLHYARTIGDLQPAKVQKVKAGDRPAGPTAKPMGEETAGEAQNQSSNQTEKNWAISIKIMWSQTEPLKRPAGLIKNKTIQIIKTAYLKASSRSLCSKYWRWPKSLRKYLWPSSALLRCGFL